MFDPAFDTHIRRRAHELCAKRSGEPGLIGWFIDNELRWGAGLARHRRPADAVPQFVADRPRPHRRERLAAPASRPHRSTPSTADSEAFVALLADRYFALTIAAIKAADPNHLVLGCRFALPPPASVIEAAGRHLDVISFNCYGPDANGALDAYAVTGKPCLIGEFSFRGADFRPAQYQRRRTAGGDARPSAPPLFGITSPRRCKGVRSSATTGSSTPTSRPKAASTARIPISARSRSTIAYTRTSRAR